MSGNKLQLGKDTRQANKQRSTNRDLPIVRNTKKDSQRSTMGYSDNSPYRGEAFININTPTGIIDMSETGMPLMANGRMLPPYSGQHQFEPGTVREEPAHQMPDGSWMAGAEHQDMELTEDEIEEYRRGGCVIEYQDGGGIPDDYIYGSEDLEEVEVKGTPYVKTEAENQQYFNDLTAEEKEYLYKNQGKSNDPIARSLMAKATEGYGIKGNPTFSESTKDVVKGLATNAVKGFGETMQTVQSLVTEAGEQLRGNDYNYRDALPKASMLGTLDTKKQRVPSETIGFKNPESTFEQGANMAMDAVVDPLSLLGVKAVGIPAKAISQAPKFIKNITKASGGQIVELDDDAIEQYRRGGYIVEDVDDYQTGGTVSELWEQKTGTPWSQAKLQGRTSGSYDDNVKLLNELKKDVLPATKVKATNNVQSGSGLTQAVENKINSSENFNEAFGAARTALGKNNTFTWNGKSYGTNLAGEKFEPNQEVLANAGLNDEVSIKEVEKQNKLIASPYTSDETFDIESVKEKQLGEPKFEDWEVLKKKKNEINKMSQADRIINFHSSNSKGAQLIDYTVKAGDNLSSIAKENGVSLEQLKKENNIFSDIIQPNQKLKISKQADPSNQYLIVDKKAGRMHLYRGDQLLESFEVLTGSNEGDGQTVTRQVFKNSKGEEVTSKEAAYYAKVGGKRITKLHPGYTQETDWKGGSKTTGAGVFDISTVNPKSGYGDKAGNPLPLFNLKNDQGNDIATSLHATTPYREKYFGSDEFEIKQNKIPNRISHGCINGKCRDIKELYDKYNLQTGNKVYILPDDVDNNEFVYENGQMNFKVKDQSKYDKYIDQKGNERDGQGISSSRNTLNALPIRFNIDKDSLKIQADSTDGWSGGWNEAQYDTIVEPYARSLEDNKDVIMKAAQINGDVYNEISKMAFGILGAESNYGDEHSVIKNVAKFVNKAGTEAYNTTNEFFGGYLPDRGAVSSPDYKSKAGTYGFDSDKRSIGLTQLRWAQLNKDEKEALTKVGITDNKALLEPYNAAKATAIVLGVRYNQQLSKEQQKDMWNYLPSKWNTGAGYTTKVQTNSRFFNVEQSDQKDEGLKGRMQNQSNDVASYYQQEWQPVASTTHVELPKVLPREPEKKFENEQRDLLPPIAKNPYGALPF